LAEIEERLKSGEYDEMFAVEELSGGMKTPTSLHEMNAQRQVFFNSDFLLTPNLLRNFDLGRYNSALSFRMVSLEGSRGSSDI